MNYTRKILSLYATIARRVKDLERLNKRDCVYSYGLPVTVEEVFKKVSKRNEEKNMLAEIKKRVELVFSRLSDDDKNVLKYRYFNILPKDGFGFSERTYYRKLLKAEKTFSLYLEFAGLGEKRMKTEFGTVKFIDNFFAIIKEEHSEKEYLKRKKKKNIDFSACSLFESALKGGINNLDKQAS